MAQIKTFARLKPTKKAYKGYEISKNVLTMHIPDNKDFVILGPQNNYRSNFSYDILFTNIFGCEASQEEVFDGVAKDIIQNFLNGYNGTIFAYGQTGTGKTYTVEGNTNKYNARGLATRALSMIYQELEKRSDQHISVYLSYLEIYQEVAYDLLNPAARSTIPIAPFAKVTVVEGPRGSCILRGLSLHLAANEEIAQMLLLQGQANRRVAETPVNQRSSRSHAVFTVYLQVRKHDSDVLVNSKLHLVDLAGSERVSKTGVDGQQLTEARSINLSLHHLETVIIALQLEKPTSAGKGENPPQQSRSNSSLMSSGPSSDNGGSRQLRFVPYRNSLLTMVLKDSLGGNCLTAMIATISLEPENLGESISTCRFAQRVARIANNARRNEEIDDKALIKRLKNKVAYLENQVAVLRSKGRSEPMTEEDIMNVLTDEDQRICERIMEGFIQGVIADPIEAGISDHCRFRACLHLLRQQYLSRSLPPPMMAMIGPNPSTSTLLPNQETGGRGMYPGEGANNPQQDSGDFASVPAGGMILDVSKRPIGKQEPLSFKLPSSKADNMTGDQVVQDAWADKKDEGTDDRKAMTPNTNKTKPTTSKKAGTNGFGGIDEVLQACSGTGSGGGGAGTSDQRYKSPYERRREKEIRRLSRKLTEMEEDKADRETYLQQMKEQAIVEELLVAETGLRLKLQVAEEQVADQHAYLLQLKHLQADPDLIAKEQLVEKQLRKRQAKFHEKLTKVLASKEKLDSDFAQRKVGTPGEGQSHQLQHQGAAGVAESRESSSKTSIEERYGQYKQGKGSLNTRQVFDLLKNQEKKQQKESAKVERETTMVKTKQLAIKEAATLEKLRELKQMLKLSLLKEEQQQQKPGSQQMSQRTELDLSASCSLGAPGHSSMRGGPSHNISLSECGESSGLMSNGLSPSVVRAAGISPASSAQAWSSARSQEQNQSQHNNIRGATAMTAEQSQSVHQFMMEMIGGSPSNTTVVSNSKAVPVSAHNHYFGVQQTDPVPSASFTYTENFVNGDAGTGNKSFAGVPSSRYNSHHKTTASGSKSFHEPRHSFKFCDDEVDPALTLSEKPERFLSSKAATSHANNNANNANISRDAELLLSDLETIPSALHNGKHQPQSYHRNNKPFTLSPASQNGQISSNISSPSVALPAQSQTTTTSTSASPLPTLLALQQQIQQHNHHSGPVVPPSEYINSMSDQDKFDARRMGLSSRTFESALTHMLELGEAHNDAMNHRNAPDLPYSVDPYAGFTRDHRQQNKSNSSPYESPYAQRVHRHASPSRKQQTSSSKSPTRAGQGRKPTTDTASAWGPDAKNASVADRLANLLDTPSSFLPASNKPSKTPERNNNRRTTSDIDAFQSKLDEFKKQSNGYSNRKADSDNDSEEDYAHTNNNNDDDCVDEEEEDRSFFGLQPAQTKLTALTAEEGEKTFLSAVAAEKARVEKIRRARNAAEVIQRSWRRYKPRQ